MFKKLCLTTAALAALSTAAFADDHATVVVVGNQDMFSTQTIVENAVNSEVHTTLVAAVLAAGLEGVLASEGPFTVFAPVNDAFENLPEGTVESLLQPEAKDALTGVLTYHVVAGALTAEDIRAAIDASGDGEATLETVAGGTLTASYNGPANIVVTDGNGGTANIVTYDVLQSNGVIHSVDKVLLPGG